MIQIIINIEQDKENPNVQVWTSKKQENPTIMEALIWTALDALIVTRLKEHASAYGQGATVEDADKAMKQNQFQRKAPLN